MMQDRPTLQFKASRITYPSMMTTGLKSSRACWLFGWSVFLMLAAMSLGTPNPVLAASENVLWSFGGNSTDGAGPIAGLIADQGGNLYGTTCLGGNANSGTVFELIPPAAGGENWTESIIANLSAIGINGNCPKGGLVMDTSGNLYGTTFSEGSNFCGAVFELLRPSSGGQWTGRAIFTFPQDGNLSCGLGGYPTGNLLIDSNGDLFGTASGGGANAFCDEGKCPGAVFELTPPSAPSGPWTESLLWSFGGSQTDGVSPYGGLVMDQGGNLYGTTIGGGAAGYGTVFELSPSTGGSWTESILWNFVGGIDGAFPAAGLAIDPSGNLYGTTQAGGVYGAELYAIDSDIFISLLFYLANGGTVFELSPPAAPGGNWTESILWSFGNGTDGASPDANLIIDASGNLFGTTQAGGLYGTASTSYQPQFNGVGGTVFELSPPESGSGDWSEAVLWNFGSGSDGLNPFAGLLADAHGNVFGTTLSGGGYAAAPTSYAGTVFELSSLPGQQIAATPTKLRSAATAVGSTFPTTIVMENK